MRIRHPMWNDVDSQSSGHSTTKDEQPTTIARRDDNEEIACTLDS